MAEQALEDTGQAFAEAVPDGILIAAADGQIVFANQQLAALAGYEPDGLVGLPVEALLPERLREVHLEHRAAFAAEPRTARWARA